MNVISMEECELLGDSKYRSYTNQIEKALKNFESTSEWADLISALTRLNKVLSTHMKYSTIPKKVTIGKRLAQCLHPALPSGVHLKAIETYDIIFKCIGRQRLSLDLFTYSAGLFPLLGYGAMNVKPALLSLYENHFVLLGHQIKPALTGLLLGLLPGLEEGSDHFDRTFNLLCRFCEESESTYFYTCLWECVLSSPDIRQAAMAFLLANFNKKQSMEDQLYFMGSNIDMLVEALCSCIDDSGVLVQRGALDFLLLGLPLHNSQLTKSDMIRVLTSAIKVVLRRDMSLNRRLYAWLLGNDANSSRLAVTNDKKTPLERQDSRASGDLRVDYFKTYSKDLLVTGLKICIQEHCSPAQMNSNSVQQSPNILRPFRILISLLDKPEVGACIIEEVFLSILQYMYYQCNQAKTASVSSQRRLSRPQIEDTTNTQDIIKTANLLFGSLDSFFIWDFLGRTFERVISTDEVTGDVSVTGLCDLIDFLLEKASLESYIEIQTEYLPNLLHHIIRSTTEHCSKLSDSETYTVLQLCSKVLSHVQPSMVPVSGSLPSSASSSPKKCNKRSQGDVGGRGSVLSDTETEVSIASMESEGVVETVEMFTTSLKVTQEEDLEEDKVKLEGQNSQGQIGDHVESETVGSSSGIRGKGSGNEESDIEDSSCSSKSNSAGIDDELNNRVDGETVGTVSEMSISAREKFEGFTSISEQHSKLETVMQACTESFRELFCVVFTRGIVKRDSKELQRYIKTLYTASSFWDMQSSQESSEGDDVGSVDFVAGKGGWDSRQQHSKKICLGILTEDDIKAFKSGCHLLMEFSSFPLYCWNSQKLLQDSFSKGFAPGLPNWLQLLISCCCFVDHFGIQSVAISTMLDLIGLAKSVDTATSADHHSTEGKVSVVIIPPISPRQLSFLENKTKFYEVVCECVWCQLGPEFSEWHQRSVDLLYQLHQLTPDPWLCEDIIGRTLTSHDKIEKLLGFHRFTVLWHLLRSTHEAPPPRKNLRTFDRSVLVMLESLQSDIHTCRSITQTWLTQALQRGDIMRLLEPMLWILLHPDTARVSIQHVKIEQPRRVRVYSESSDSEAGGPGSQYDVLEAKIYAISSEGGNVIYHVSNQENSNKASHLRFKQALADGHKKGVSRSGEIGEGRSSATVTAVTENGKSATLKAGQESLNQSELHFDKVDPNDVTLTFNPMQGQAGYEKVYEEFIAPSSDNQSVFERAKRLDAETCKKEGLFFDDDVDNLSLDTLDGSDEVVIEPRMTAEEIVRSFLEELIDSAIVTSELNEPVRIRLSSVQSRESLNLCTEDLLNAIDSKVSEIDSQSDVDGGSDRYPRESSKKLESIVHPLHTHILLYTQKYDTGRTLYALSCLKSLLRTVPRLFTCAVSTTSLGSSSSPQVTRLLGLLIRHRRAVFGKNFYSEVTGENVGALKGSMLVETLICVLLYFIRSYYPNLLMASLADLQLEENKQVQILACEVLSLLLAELINVTRDSGRGFATYISDLLSRCKVQKSLLHCTLASVYNGRQRESGYSGMRKKEEEPFTESIFSFNRQDLDFNTNDCTFQVKLLKLLTLLVLLEDRIRRTRSEAESLLLPEWETSRVNFQPSLSIVRYVQSHPLIYQTMFLSAVISALKQQHMCSMHQHWLDTVTCVLPYMARTLSHSIVCVVLQLCKNLELLAGYYMHGPRQNRESPSDIPPDHILCMLESLTTLVHYCLLDSAQQDIWVAQHLPSSSASTLSEESSPSAHILSNLINIFRPYGTSRESSPDKDVTTNVSPVLEARRKLLSNLPRIVACLSSMWHATEKSRCHAVWTTGTPKAIRQRMIEFLSPIACNHGVNLMGAIAVVWNDRREKGLPKMLSVLPGVSENQLLLVDLIGAIKVLPQDTLIQTVTQVIKQPPPTTHDKSQKKTPLEVHLLQFFFAYVQPQPGKQLVECWPSLLNLLKEGAQLSLPPLGQFLLLGILNDFVQKVPMFDDKKDQKDLQDICQKLLEGCSEIAGSQLEQKSLLSRSLVVKPGSQVDVNDAEESLLDSPVNDAPRKSGKSTQSPVNGTARSTFSVHALVLLGELTATLLDMVYRSEEKDKVVPFLIAVLLNVFPYLRQHSVENLPSLRGASLILANLSGYQYTRRAWKREAFELLMDQTFFQIDVVCLKHWKTIIDNLMTNDKTTFKDLLAKVVITPGSSLSLFTSKEQEWEQRCQLLKRLTFVIFCSDVDQYQRAMPDIQERLSDCLRPPLIPIIQAQVFYCFRVLVLRISPHNITSLWPAIMTELVQVLSIMEQEISPDPGVNAPAHLDFGNNGISSGLEGHPGWLRLYLSACKLLDMVLCMPTHLLPQFQLYKWAFVGEKPDDDEDSTKYTNRGKEKQLFYPHVTRIVKHMRRRYGDSTILEGYGQPLLTMRTIGSLRDLHPFFTTLAWGLSRALNKPQPVHSILDHPPAPGRSVSKSKSTPEGFLGAEFLSTRGGLPLVHNPQCASSSASKPDDSVTLQMVETMVQNDFLDPLIQK